MIPPLDDNGYFPPGLHNASIDELIDRFGVGSAQRTAQTQSLRWLDELCLTAQIKRMLVNGSFVTDR